MSAKEATKEGSPMTAERTDVLSPDELIRQEGMNWFVLRVASNKESSVRETLLRKVQIEKMAHLVGRILVPTEKTKTIKGGKQRIVETKLYPGYVFVEMRLEPDGRIPQDVFFLINFLFAAGEAPFGEADANGDLAVDVADVFYLINYLFAAGPAPARPL